MMVKLQIRSSRTPEAGKPDFAPRRTSTVVPVVVPVAEMVPCLQDRVANKLLQDPQGTSTACNLSLGLLGQARLPKLNPSIEPQRPAGRIHEHQLGAWPSQWR